MPRLDPLASGRHTDTVTSRQGFALSIALIATAGGALRVVAALLRRPWHDEYFTVWVASRPWREMVPALAQDSGPPLPYVLAKLLATSGAGALASARGLAVIAGTLAILAVAHAAATTGGGRAGGWAATVLAVHPLAIAWSAEGRAYAYLLLAAALVWDGLAELAVRQRGAGRLALGVTLALWTHGLGLILLATSVSAAVLLPTAARRKALPAAGLATLSFLPWLPVMLQQPAASVAWMQRAWQSLPGWRAALAPFELLVPAGRFGDALDLPSAPVPVVVAGAAAALGLVGSAVLAYRGRVILALALAAVPALVLAVLAHLSLPVFYPGRGEALYLAPFVGLLAAGAARGRAAALVAALLVAAGTWINALALANWRSTPPRPEEHLTAALLTHLPGGGTVLIEGYWRLGLWFHLGEDRSRFDLRVFPSAADAHPGWYEGKATTADAEAARLWLASELQQGAKVACVLPPLQVDSALRPAAAAAGLTPVVRTAGAELWIRREAVQ